MFSLYFLVLLINSYTSILAAPLLITSSLGLLSGEIPNLAFPLDSTLRNQSTLGVLPTDPLRRHIRGSTITIIFRNYTVTISRSDSKRCVEAVMGDILAHGDRTYSKVNTPREYAWGTVELSIFPEDAMRWLEMACLASAIEAWLKVYDSVDMDFDVVVNGVGTVGTGRLASVL